MIATGKGAQRPVDDFMLTRYACYLIAQNGDPRKEAIAFAQAYFALQPTSAIGSNPARSTSLAPESVRYHMVDSFEKLRELAG